MKTIYCTVLSLLAFGLFLSIGIAFTPNKPVNIDLHTYETDDLSFQDYEILYPDYVHLDTLIVINADSLNWCMEFYNIASDGDINDVLRAYCVPLNDELRQAWKFALLPDGGICAGILNDEIKNTIIDLYFDK
jgi:hypothetical protein